MFKRKLFWLGVVLVVVMLVAAVGCTPDEIQALKGTLQNVDSVSGTITVKLNDNTTQTYNFTDVKLETIRQALGGASLEIGDQITLKVHENGDLEEINTEYAEVDGVISSVVGNDVKITARGGDVTLHVTGDTIIRIEDKGTAVIGDLKAGQEVEARYDVSTNNAIRISVEDAEEDAGELEGTIKEVNKEAGTVKISTRSSEIVLTVVPGTIIRIEDKGTATIGDLSTGQKVEVRYDVGTKNIIKLIVDDGDSEKDD